MKDEEEVRLPTHIGNTWYGWDCPPIATKTKIRVSAKIDFQGELFNILQQIQSFSDGLEDISFATEYDSCGCDNCSLTGPPIIRGWRVPTEEEQTYIDQAFAKRAEMKEKALAAKKASEEKKAAEELEIYLRLKEKFEAEERTEVGDNAIIRL